ncbi:recombinase family protein [Neobacillus novalis]|uniref:Recombinase family protein n=1 Tax=Neobacillus novalis TaxID=220687 RepID=A0AA95SCN1_9BACI|nr:recombinase family protein [Neobacillus novalis]WHY86323.1 recombinase family protein [Neobacillus novalis]
MVTKNEAVVVGIYIRVSTDKQANEGYSLDGQKEVGTEKAIQMFGSNVILEYYVDGGISGKSTKNRPDLQRMMKDINKGILHAVITYKVSRLSRSLSDSLKLVEEIDRAKVRFISLKEGEYGTPHGNLQFNILASVAQYQREELAENVQMGMAQKAREGKWNGGQVLGYQSKDKELIIVPSEAETVKLVYNKFVNEGWGLKKIACHLNLIGIRTKNGKSFTPNTTSIILSNPVYAGYIRFNQYVDWEKKRRGGKNPDAILVKGSHEAIIYEETWNKAQEIAKERATGTPRQYTGTFPLTRLARCPECGSYMTSCYGGTKRKDGTKPRYYCCGEYHNKGKAVCHSNSIRADWLEKEVFDRLTKAMMSDEIITDITQRINNLINDQYNKTEQSTELQHLQKRIVGLEARKKRIQESVELELGLFTPEEARERMAQIREEIAEVNTLLIKAQQQSNNSNSIRPVSEDFIRLQLKEFLDLANQLEPLEFRQLLEASIEKIEATKGELKHIYFSFIAHPSDKELGQVDPSLHIENLPTSLLLRGLLYEKKRYLLVIRFPPINPISPINLFHQNQPHQLVGKSHPRK